MPGIREWMSGDTARTILMTSNSKHHAVRDPIVDEDIRDEPGVFRQDERNEAGNLETLDVSKHDVIEVRSTSDVLHLVPKSVCFVVRSDAKTGGHSIWYTTNRLMRDFADEDAWLEGLFTTGGFNQFESGMFRRRCFSLT